MIDNGRRTRPEMVRSPGCIISEGMHLTCIILDRSSTGARLAEFGAITLPPSFMLRLGSEGSFMVRCWLVWQEENEAGVTFIKSEAPKTT